MFKFPCSVLLLLLLSFNVKAMQFFKTPQSLFPSGETSVYKLEKSASSAEFTFNLLVQSGNNKYWIPATKIARDLDLSDSVIYQNQNYWLHEVRGYWAVLERIDDGKTVWAPVVDLKASGKDLGKALTLISTSLRAEPNWKSELILQMPAQTSLRILQITNSWLKVQFESVVGYVDLNNVLMKADFAKEIMDRKGKWYTVKYREGFFMSLVNGGSIAIDEVKEWHTDNLRGVLIGSVDEKHLFLRQNFTIEKVQAQVWTISDLPGHGKVFWKKADTSVPHKNQTATNGEDKISSEDLLKREIFSISFDPDHPALGLVSSQGVFKTEDSGLTWTKIDQFGNENHPVSISPDGAWYVGFMKSKNRGQTFHQYVRTDSLTRLVQSQSRGAPRIIRLSEITAGHNKLQIKLDTGTKTIRLATRSKSDVITEWDFID